MIRFLFASLLFLVAVAFTATADTRDVYTIRDIKVDEQAGSVIEARERAMASARLIAAKALINRITLAEDRSAAGGVPITSQLAERLSAAVDVQEETAGAGRYRGTLAVVLNPRMVRAHLDSLKVPYVDSQGPVSLIIPLASNIGVEGLWREALDKKGKNALLPFVTSTSGAYTPQSDWTAMASEAGVLGAKRGVLAELAGRDGAYRVTLSTVTAAGATLIGTTSSKPTLAEAAGAASAYLDENWKQASIVRGGTRTIATASVRYTSLPEWNTLRGALARSPLVSDFKISAIARDGAQVTFAFAGDRPRLENDLLQRGVSLSDDGRNWVLQSAVSRAVAQ